MHLLGVVKRIVYHDDPGVAGCTGARWWWCEDLIGREVSTNTHFAHLANVFVICPICSHNGQVLQCTPNCCSERLAVCMMVVLLAGIASKDQALAMITIDGISFFHR